ncbi:MAG: hypothetical protein DU481_10660 [Nitrosomonas sp.]|uniref:hypothetical protein n=1 Tax=Nitrosomonas sp. TaxID=42353 RepID=UPI0032F0603C
MMEEVFKALVTQYQCTFEVLKIIGAPLVAIAVAIAASLIQYNQWRTTRDKLRLDLFDKRFRVYIQLFIFLNERLNKTEFTHEEWREFEFAINESRFLFDKSTYDYIVNLKDLLTDYRIASFVGKQRSGQVTAESKHKDLLSMR